MKIGAMNNPHEDVYKQIRWIGRNRFDFIDFTVEPEFAMPHQIDIPKAKALMSKYGLDIVGHMGDWRLPKDSAYPRLRREAGKEIILAIRTLKRLGARNINFHAPVCDKYAFDVVYKWNLVLLRNMLKEAKRLRVDLMMENSPHNEPHNIRLYTKLLDTFPAINVHLDVGHANIGIRTDLTERLMKRYSNRVAHIHLSDNYGNADNHKALGSGSIPWTKIIKTLKKYKYDGTITLETFNPSQDVALSSAKKLRKWWDRY